MTTNADAVKALVQSKKALQAQCDAASGDILDQLISTIQNISGEIGKLEREMLESAQYIPSTDPFKRVTNESKSFLTTLKKLKATFANVSAVARELDLVIGLIV